MSQTDKDFGPASASYLYFKIKMGLPLSEKESAMEPLPLLILEKARNNGERRELEYPPHAKDHQWLPNKQQVDEARARVNLPFFDSKKMTRPKKSVVCCHGVFWWFLAEKLDGVWTVQVDVLRDEDGWAVCAPPACIQALVQVDVVQGMAALEKYLDHAYRVPRQKEGLIAQEVDFHEKLLKRQLELLNELPSNCPALCALRQSFTEMDEAHEKAVRIFDFAIQHKEILLIKKEKSNDMSYTRTMTGLPHYNAYNRVNRRAEGTMQPWVLD